ncbi:MAG: SDR family oxidoreductase [Actinomycetota bacterium]
MAEPLSETDHHPDPADEFDPEEGFIAVVGMAGRYPEAPNLDAFWQNLRDGRDCLRTFTDDELDELGIPADRYNAENFVRRGTVLPDHDRFDAAFFGFTPRQAEIMDPQSRIFLETCYEALESAGYNPFDTGQSVGVFGGSNPCDYASLVGVADPSDSLDAFDQLIGLDRDFLTTRVSHHLGLNGPSLTLQTACSTSLVAVHVAVQSLLAFECSMALAGGVTVNFRQGVGYFHQQGMILSPSGQCRAFDADASGTTLGQGCGVVVLKRLDDALADGDHILAVVRGSAINNDAGAKMTYTAPSEDGQTAVIAAAQEIGGVDPDTIGYVETHGTGTLLGDPIEIAALTRAFRAGTDRRQFCAIGSVKTNVGHTDAAAGVTGFIKAVLALHHRELPPSIHFTTPNPAINFADSPFYVNADLQPWADGPNPRRAGVSAFGIGGTNAHVVLEEAPATPPRSTEDRDRLLVVSGKTAAAADRRLADLATALANTGTSDGGNGTTDQTASSTRSSADPALVDTAFTLRTGRPHLEHRRAVVVGPDRSLKDLVTGQSDRRVVQGSVLAERPRLVWTFSGQGSQYPGMGHDLYRSEPTFRDAMDTSADLFQELLGVDLRALLYGGEDPDGSRLQQTAVTQPALFAVQRALAELLRSWGLAPDAVIGHSIGEYAAAVDAGIMSWSGAAHLVAERGRLMQSMAPGSMLSVGLDPDALTATIGHDQGDVAGGAGVGTAGVGVAAHNAPGQSVLSGPTEQIETMEHRLAAHGVATQLLRTSHAFHSDMMREAAAKFETIVADADLNPPTIPLISNVTGQPMTDREATDPRFWAEQILRPVRFADCVTAAVTDGPAAFLELGPGQVLTTLTRSSTDPATAAVTATMRRPKQDRDDRIALLEAVGRLWTAGVDVDLARLERHGPADGSVDDRSGLDTIDGAGAEGRRVPLPTYPFDRIEAWRPAVRHVLALPTLGQPEPAVQTPLPTRQPIDRWLYVPSWQRDPMPDTGGEHHHRPDRTVADPHAGGPTDVPLLLIPEGPGGDALAARLRADGTRWLVARPGTATTRDDDNIRVNPTDDNSFTELFDLLTADGVRVAHITHALLADPGPADDNLNRSLDEGLHTALACARALGSASRTGPAHLDLVTVGACSVIGDERVRPAAAALLGPTRVIPLEYSNVTTRLLDLATGLSAEDDRAAVAAHLGVAEREDVPDAVVAVRHRQRWTPTVAPRPAAHRPDRSPLKPGGTYVIIGGLGGVGLSVARYLAEEYNASLVLTGRRGRPRPPEDGSPPDPETAGRLAVIERIEAAANSVDIAAVDATDQIAMTNLISRVTERNGRIDGVIVAAGQADQQGAIHRRSRADTIQSIEAKVQGLMVLEQALEQTLTDKPEADGPDFVLLSSSVASTLYHNRFAQVGYVAGNSFAEAFAHRGRQRGLRTLTVAWDDWTEIGMSVRAAQSFAENYGSEVELVDQLHSFTPDDGIALFERALQADEPVVVVSTTDLAARIAADVDVVSPFLQQATADEDLEAEPAAGDSLAETVLATWRNILGYTELDLTADFFELGGDSLQAARMTDRLSRTLGIEIPVDLMFDASQAGALVAALEPLVGRSGEESDPDAAPVVRDRGRVPLGPNQQRFVSRNNPNPNHFNIVILLEPRHRIAVEDLRTATAAMVARHDALRVRLAPPDPAGDSAEDRAWGQILLSPEALDDPVMVVDLSPMSPADAAEALTTAAAKVQLTLDLVDGPLFRVVLFELPDGAQRLLLLSHHLISDRVSLLLLMDGLADGLQAAAEGRELHTGAATSSLDWAEALRRSTETPETEQEVTRWCEKPWDRLAPLPHDKPFDPADNRNENVGVIAVEIAANDVPATVDADNNGTVRQDELILACLCRALGEWNGSELAHVDVLGFGRRLPMEMDVSRSLGMFITYSPVMVDLRATPDPRHALPGIQEDLDQSWRLDPARLAGPEPLRSELGALPRPEVLFNFVGKPVSAEVDGLLMEAPEPAGPSDDRGGRRGHLIGVRVDAANDGTLTLVFVYSRAANRAASIQALAERTKELVISTGSD